MSKISVHVGNMLMMAARTYNTVGKTVLEGVQNAIDAKATTIFVGFDMQERISVIADDGVGASVEKFENGLMAVGQTQKSRQRDALGKFGLGLVSPLDKCETFVFVSRPGRRKPIHAWVFNQERIKECATDPDIPMLLLPDMPTLESNFQTESLRIGGEWNTIVRMRKITTDRTVSRLTINRLQEDIRSRFGEAMRAKKTVCHIFIRDENGKEHRAVVEPTEYSGEPIEGSPFVFTSKNNKKAGKITIELYRAVQSGGKRKGTVKISEGKGAVFGIPLKQFVAQARRDLDYDTQDSFEELTGGYFEGLIRADGISLSANRTEFDPNDEFLDCVMALDEWYGEVGKEFYEDEQFRARDDRYRDLTNRALEEVQKIFAGNSFDDELQIVRDSIDIGLIGSGHVEQPDIGKSEDKFKRSGRKGGGSRPAPGGRASSPVTGGDKKPKTRDRDTPFGRIDDDGRRRTQVRDGSTGLWIEVTEFELSDDLWRFDSSQGKLLFNCANHVWADLDGASSDTRHKYQDMWIILLQKWVISEVIQMLRQPADRHEDIAQHSRSGARLYAELCIKPVRNYS